MNKTSIEQRLPCGCFIRRWIFGQETTKPCAAHRLTDRDKRQATSNSLAIQTAKLRALTLRAVVAAPASSRVSAVLTLDHQTLAHVPFLFGSACLALRQGLCTFSIRDQATSTT